MTDAAPDPDLKDPSGIYLDYQATTPLDPRVLAAMLPHLGTLVGNPHSSRHAHGIAAMEAVRRARAQVAELVGAQPDEIIFTSGATEANNLAMKGVLTFDKARRRLVTVATEHHAVLDVGHGLCRRGVDLEVVGVDEQGIVDLRGLEGAVDARTELVSVMAANNEIGVVQPIRDLAAIAHAAGALFHTDAAQAVGKVPLDVRSDGIDLMSISGHKIYGPMGIGALYASRAAARRLKPIIEGGGQELGYRSGTLPVALCVGLGEACYLARMEMAHEGEKLKELRAAFLGAMQARGVAFQINGSMERRIPGNLNVSFAGVDAEALMMRLRGKVSVASGSACTSDSLEPSHVVLALGHGQERAEEAIRIGFGRTTTLAEVLIAAEEITHAVARLSRVGYNRRRME